MLITNNYINKNLLFSDDGNAEDAGLNHQDCFPTGIHMNRDCNQEKDYDNM